MPCSQLNCCSQSLPLVLTGNAVLMTTSTFCYTLTRRVSSTPSLCGFRSGIYSRHTPHDVKRTYRHTTYSTCVLTQRQYAHLIKFRGMRMQHRVLDDVGRVHDAKADLLAAVQ